MAHNNRCISLVHHHLEPGGVAQVVELSVRALASCLPGLREIRLVSGRPGGAGALLERLQPDCDRNGVSISLTIIEEIDYLSIDYEPEGDTDQVTDLIKRKLLKACSGSTWIIHNYHLGKNPLFTRALLDIAHNHKDERLFFYIHDFPECSRYENLVFSRRFISRSPYPVTSNVRYVVINSRDLKYLTEAGIPESHVYLLNNPVPDEELPAGDRDARKKNLEEELLNGLWYTPGAPLLLYPVRTIRRKNVLEMGLLCAAAPNPVNLLVTLPGVSQAEKEYSDKVAKAFSDGLIPGMWGIGTRLQEADLSFHELVSIADVICSSSVQEGFGYLFINSRLWGIPLLARYLEVLDGIKPVFSDHPSCFYRSLCVPSNAEEVQSLRTAYAEKARRVESLLGEDIVDLITEQFSSIAEDETIDFSYLPVDRQVQVLDKVKKDTAFRNDIVRLNAGIFDALGKFAGVLRPPVSGARPDYWPFSFETYAGAVGEIIDSFATVQERQLQNPPDVRRNLIRRFASIEYLRLLYDG